MERFDVVVLGTGAAGLTAAIVAHEGGASVAVFEKADLVGGTTAWSGGQVWIPNNPHMPEVGVEDSRDKAAHVHHVAVARAARAASSWRPTSTPGPRWSSCWRRRRRSSSTPCPACPTTTRSSPGQPGRWPDAGVPDLPVRRARRVGRPRHAVAVLRRSAHHDERDAARQGGAGAAVGRGARAPAASTTSAAAARRWPGGCSRACLDRGIEPRTSCAGRGC